MKTWTVDEVMNVAGHLKMDGQMEDMPIVVKMLTDYAERIKADTRADAKEYQEGQRVVFTNGAGNKFPATVVRVVDRPQIVYHLKLDDGCHYHTEGKDIAEIDQAIAAGKEEL